MAIDEYNCPFMWPLFAPTNRESILLSWYEREEFPDNVDVFSDELPSWMGVRHGHGMGN
jgi:hypothetical protein